MNWAAFPTCAYRPELEEGNKFFKPQRFLGSVLNLSSVSADCSCTNGSGHKEVTIADSKASAEYPPALCDCLADVTVAHLDKIATLEWLKLKREYLAREITRLSKAPEGIEDPKSQDVMAKFDVQMKAEDISTEGVQDGTTVVSSNDYKGTKADASHKNPRSGPPFKNIVSDNKDATSAWKPGAGNYGQVESALRQVNEEPHLARALGVRTIAAWSHVSQGTPKQYNSQNVTARRTRRKTRASRRNGGRASGRSWDRRALMRSDSRTHIRSPCHCTRTCLKLIAGRQVTQSPKSITGSRVAPRSAWPEK